MFCGRGLKVIRADWRNPDALESLQKFNFSPAKALSCKDCAKYKENYCFFCKS
jgi:hypothetical protein